MTVSASEFANALHRLQKGQSSSTVEDAAIIAAFTRGREGRFNEIDIELVDAKKRLSEIEVERGKVKLELLNIAQWLASYSAKSLIAQEIPSFHSMMRTYAHQAVKACDEAPLDDENDLFEQISDLMERASEEAYPPTQDGTRRYWASWYSRDDTLESRDTPFQFWVTGSTTDISPRFTFCALIAAASRDALWDGVQRWFSDFEPRFCNAVSQGYAPSDRFEDFENRTGLT